MLNFISVTISMAIFIFTLGIAIYANIEYRNKRAKMTPSQLKEYDEEEQQDLMIW